MHQDKLIVAVKLGGKVLREHGDTVYLPFGSEYSVLVKNLNSVRSCVEISIDGEKATGQNLLILEPNSETELQRFIRNGNLASGNALKFIERTEAVEAFRGPRVDDGILRVEAWREKVYAFQPYARPWPRYPVPATPDSRPARHMPPPSGKLRGGMGRMASSSPRPSHPMSRGGGGTAAPPSRPGVTVPGSYSDQTFVIGANFPVHPDSTVIVLRLSGTNAEGIPIERPLTVDLNPTCISCGKAGSAHDDYCARCGTALVLV